MTKLSTYTSDIRMIWLLSVAASVAVVAASFFLTIENIESGALSRLSIPHDHCLLCGMSHSFVFMSDWHLEEAFDWNAGGPFLYLLMVLNVLVGLSVVSKDTILRRLNFRK